MFSKEEAKQLRLAFWQKLENRTRRLPGQRGEVKKWILDNTGIRGVDLRFDVDRQKAMVALEISHRDEDRRLMLFAKLDACKNIFEESFGTPLTWELAYEKSPGHYVSRVFVQMQGDIYQQEQWPSMIKFLIYNMVNLETAFLEVKDFLKYDELGQ
ncbi:uncharacterized protein DUF4268 [Breznakibacter xylanolyticus]|uniref:Uncharacterized protein DUF4268 n=1 Tax=Breznakibacter xylanolyticus TaxID=990 RepID=A0A2W7NGS8_9BACT|nr:DUF4268 domain-containing protein [Breznakibacter xylanolyticus]MBN2743146.1 DUF4268 domain-containing protein [Marinilabiliaceae bacterium]PZX15894.1 uncharacterized protein DUF4268 [Breznakibacter xylanolyticus]